MTLTNPGATVFVSYARRDLHIQTLRTIARQTSVFGIPYIDDLHNHSGSDRTTTVLAALYAADTFVAVVSPHYRTTAWTTGEFDVATRRGIPIIARLSDGRLLHESSLEWPWHVACRLPQGGGDRGRGGDHPRADDVAV